MSKVPGANLEFVREDDFVEYYVFPKLTKAQDQNEEQLRQQLEQVRADCMSFVAQKVQERSYIWHKDEFQLISRTGSTEERLLNEEDKKEDDDGDEEEEGQGNYLLILLYIALQFGSF